MDIMWVSGTQDSGSIPDRTTKYLNSSFSYIGYVAGHQGDMRTTNNLSDRSTTPHKTMSLNSARISVHFLFLRVCYLFKQLEFTSLSILGTKQKLEGHVHHRA